MDMAIMMLAEIMVQQNYAGYTEQGEVLNKAKEARFRCVHRHRRLCNKNKKDFKG